MKKIISIVLAVALSITALVLPTHAATDIPVVIENTHSAVPGSAIGIYGANFSSEETKVLLAPMSNYSDTNTYSLYDLNILTNNDGVIMAELPSSLQKDNYIGFVKTNVGISKPFYINTPEIDWISEPEICKGQTVRIFGKNFLNPKTGKYDGAKLYVCSTDGEQTLEAEIKTATEYTVDFIVPNGVTEGKHYIVKYNNGASEYGLMSLDSSEAVPCVTDFQMQELKSMYGVEVAWASNLNLKDSFNIKKFGATGDGISDDLMALKKALEEADANGGGIVYLPEGEYNITSLEEALEIPDKVIISGDGKDKTIINTNKRIYFGKNYGGITRLTIKSDAVRPADDTARYIFGYVGSLLYANNPNISFFAKDIDIDIADGSAFASYGAKHIVFEGCKIDITHAGPVIGFHDRNIKFKTRFVGNEIKNTQRPMIMFGDYSWISDNKFVGDNCGENGEKADGKVVTMEHRITDMWGDKLYFAYNDISGTIGDIREEYDDNSGEGICNQIPGQIAISSVVGASGNTLETSLDLDAMLKGESGENGKRLIGAKVVILSGDGIGQIRKITGTDAKKLQMESEWDIVPEKNDTFMIDCGIAEENIIVNNNITAQTRKAGIMMFMKSANCIISGNTLTNSGGIWFGSAQNASQTRTGMSYFNYVEDNILSGGVKDKEKGDKDNALSIGPGDDGGVKITLDNALPELTAYFGNVYRDNFINGRGSNIKAESERNGDFVNYNGIVVTTPASSSVDYANGTIVANNSVSNSINGVTVSSIANNTLIYKNNFTDNLKNYNDVNSRNTVIVEKDDVETEAVTVSSTDAGISLVADIVKNPAETILDAPDVERYNPFSDIDSHWAKENILLLTELNILKGYDDGTFRPDDKISRAEFVSIIWRCMGLSYNSHTFEGLFNDVSKNDWYGTTLERAFLCGLIDKNMINDWYISPQENLTREEMASIAVLGLRVKGKNLEKGDVGKFIDSHKITPWALEYMQEANGTQLMIGNDNNELNPTECCTRAEATIVINKLLVLINN